VSEIVNFPVKNGLFIFLSYSRLEVQNDGTYLTQIKREKTYAKKLHVKILYEKVGVGEIDSWLTQKLVKIGALPK
jgi:hypothetical protein